MRHVAQWVVAIAVVTGGLVGIPRGLAQPTVRDHRANPPPNERDHRTDERDHRAAPPPPAQPSPPPAQPSPPPAQPTPPPPPTERDHRRAAGPPDAPPPPRAETPSARAGFVWIPGRWDWRGRWEWIAGHEERERPGKKWREGRWERKGDAWAYIDGEWIEGGGARPADDYPREAPPPPRDEHPEARAGFVWIIGRWDWRAGKWEWVPGHWERERAGRRWNPGHWDKQGDRWAYVEGSWAEGVMAPPADNRPPPPPPPPAPPAADRPYEAPPPPRVEQPEARAGFVFLRGRWDWRGGKWEWIPGHWERPHAGKRWREGRWEQRDGAWALIEGDWEDEGAPPPPPPPTSDEPPRDHREHRREWRLDRPTVSSYWPIKGKAGGRVVIHGRNFPDDTVVLWNGTQVPGARVTPDEIVVAVPPDAATGMITLRTGHRRELAVGTYEVANYDAEAEARRLADEARRKAEAEWAERQRQLAKDRAARLAEFERRHQELVESREQRRAERLRELRARWEAAFLGDQDTQAELTLHAERVAELGRMREVAELSGNGKLVIRIGVAQSREDERHQERMSALHDAFGRKP